MKDPFQTLGVSPGAGEDEIKAAYRKLAKQYHPDLHPGDKNAEARMKEINEAYAEAMRVKKSGGYRAENYGDHAGPFGAGGTAGGYGGPGGFGGAYGQPQWDPFGFGGAWGFGNAQRRYQASGSRYDDPELQAASDFISQGRYQDALNLLNRMTARDAAWHYLSALASMGQGNRIAALNHSRQAVQMDPGNAEYASLLNQLQGSGSAYRSRGGTGGIGDLLCANPCFTLCAANALLNCLCGGRYIMCC